MDSPFVRKTRADVQAGFVDPRKLRFTADYRRQVREVPLGPT